MPVISPTRQMVLRDLTHSLRRRKASALRPDPLDYSRRAKVVAWQNGISRQPWLPSGAGLPVLLRAGRDPQDRRRKPSARRRIWSSKPSTIVIAASVTDLLFIPTLAASGILMTPNRFG
jgi:hypothetical protein